MYYLGARLLREQESGFLSALRDASQFEVCMVQEAFHAYQVNIGVVICLGGGQRSNKATNRRCEFWICIATFAVVFCSTVYSLSAQATLT